MNEEVEEEMMTSGIVVSRALTAQGHPFILIKHYRRTE
jgi:hypothetical protein